MIKKFGDYSSTKAYGDYQTLPKGGYVIKILGVETARNSRGDYLIISCDIAEGDYKSFFAERYREQTGEDKKWGCNYFLGIPNDDGTEQDGWTKRSFKTFTEALEDSNSGYHFDWDETKFKGKLVGGLFNEREYTKKDGTTGRATNLASFTSVEKIRSGKFALPKDKLISGGSAPANSPTSGFTEVEDSVDDLPF
ncbi:MAG: hypothetical protein Q4P20_10915 [Eubacteriales bacterium]|nr:hypothetical protein [Eubacteriales bacterium]